MASCIRMLILRAVKAGRCVALLFRSHRLYFLFFCFCFFYYHLLPCLHACLLQGYSPFCCSADRLISSELRVCHGRAAGACLMCQAAWLHINSVQVAGGRRGVRAAPPPPAALRMAAHGLGSLTTLAQVHQAANPKP